MVNCKYAKQTAHNTAMVENKTLGYLEIPLGASSSSNLPDTLSSTAVDDLPPEVAPSRVLKYDRFRLKLGIGSRVRVTAGAGLRVRVRAAYVVRGSIRPALGLAGLTLRRLGPPFGPGDPCAPCAA